MTDKIFISYSKKDSEFAHKLADDLEAAGFKIWIDRSIGGGDLWRETIEKNLRAAGEVIIVVSPNSMASEWVKHEGSLAYGWEKHLFPILTEPVESLPPWLDEYQWIDFVNTPYKTAFDALVAALTPPNPIQDLLDQQVQVYKQTGELIGEAILRVLEENHETLKVSAEAKDIIEQSQNAIEERQKSELEKAQQLARTQRQRAIVLTLGLLVAVVLSVISFFLYQQSNQNLSDARAANTQSAANAAEAQAASAHAVAEQNVAATAQNLAEQKALIALSGQLASQSTQLLDSNLDLSLLLSAEAYDSIDNFASLRSLFYGWQYNLPILRYIQGVDCDVTSLDINVDNHTAAFGCSNGKIRISDITTGKLLTDGLLEHGDEVVSLAFSIDGQILASGSKDSSLRLWNTTTWEPIGEPLIKLTGEILNLIFHPDNGTLAVAVCTIRDDFINRCAQSEIYLVDIVSGIRTYPTIQVSGRVYDISLNLDGTLLASAGCKLFEIEFSTCLVGEVMLWEVATGKPFTENTLESNFEFTSVEFNNIHNILAAGTCGERQSDRCTRGQVQFWDLEDQSIFTETVSGHIDKISSVAFNPDGQSMASAGWDGNINFWDFREKNFQSIPPFDSIYSGHKAEINIAFSPDGKFLVSEGEDQSIIVWNTEMGARDRTRTPLAESGGSKECLALSPQNEMIAFSEGYINGERYHNNVEVLDLKNNKSTKILLNSDCEDLTFNTNGDLLATLDVGGFVQLWNSQSGQTIGSFTVSPNKPTRIEFGHTDDRIFTVSSDEFTEWDIGNSKAIRQIEFEESNWEQNAVISPDKQLLALPNFGFIDLIDIAYGEIIDRYIIDNPNLMPLAFSPDGKMILTAPCISRDWQGECILSEIHLVDITAKPLKRTVVSKLDRYVSELVFSPDGNMFASGICREIDWSRMCIQYEIWLWDTATGQFYGPPLNANVSVSSSLRFFQDGKILISVGERGPILSWSMDPKEWVEGACVRAGRNLTETEWNQYLSWKGPFDPEYKTCPQWPAGQ